MTIRINPIDKHVGSRARMRRIMLNKSQTEVADALGLTFQQLQKYEKGENRIGASRLQQLCRILEVPWRFSSREHRGCLDFRNRLRRAQRCRRRGS
jgi:transcriptional regulator with XRE-family HTH domain